MRASNLIRFSVLGITVATVSAVVGRGIVRLVARWEATEYAENHARQLAAAYTRSAYDSATVEISGTLTAQAAALLGEAGVLEPILVLVRARDCFTCEDLDRQLRELVGSSQRAVVVMTEHADTALVKRFLHRYRVLGLAGVIGINLDSVLVTKEAVQTPAALVVQSAGAVHGIAHTLRFRNTRPRSFADELRPFGL